MKNFKTRLKKQILTLGSWLTIPDLTIAEIIAKQNFEFLVVDMEHSSINNNQALDIIRLIDNCNKNVLVRLPNFNVEKIKKILDFGAHGLIFPDVRTLNDAKKITESTYYAPKGSRGMGLHRAQNFGENLNEYIKWSNKNLSIILQIEHYKAIEELDEMLKLDRVDGILVGPYDLTASICDPGNFNNERYKKILNKIIKITKKRKKTIGFHLVDPTDARIKKLIRLGFNLIVCGVDFKYLIKGLKTFDISNYEK